MRNNKKKHNEDSHIDERLGGGQTEKNCEFHRHILNEEEEEKVGENISEKQLI